MMERRRAAAVAAAAGVAVIGAGVVLGWWGPHAESARERREEPVEAEVTMTEEEEKEAWNQGSGEQGECKVARIMVYPVKSMKGVDMQEAQLQPEGFEHDRRWMVVDDRGNFMSQRRLGRLALVQPAVREDVYGRTVLRLSCPAMDHAIEVPICTSAAARRETPVRVWDDYVDGAFDQGEPAARWLDEALRSSGLRLVYFGPGCNRPVPDKYAVKPGDSTSFADGFPFLVISQASLEDLNRRVYRADPEGKRRPRKPLTMERFRPNIVVSGLGPFEEDQLRTMDIGGARLHMVKPCGRCKIITLDPDTGKGTTPYEEAEPLRTMREFRLKGEDVMIGQNLIWEAPESGERQTLRVGDAFTFTRREAEGDSK